MLLTLLWLFLLRQLILRSLRLTSFLTHYLEDGEEARSGNIDDVLVEFEHEAAISNNLPSLFEALIEIGLLLQFDAPVIQSIGVKSGEPIFSPVLTLVVHDVIVV